MPSATEPKVATGQRSLLRVLYVSHTSVVGGAERSLLELLRHSAGAVEAHVICPPGALADAVARLGIPVRHTNAVRLGFRLHPVATLRGLLGTLRTAYDVREAARVVHADVVHANSVRAGFAAILASVAGAPRPIVHARDTMPASVVGRIAARFVRSGARLVLANSVHTARSLGRDTAGRVRVVENPVDVERFAVARPDEPERSSGRPVLGVVAQLTPWKGQDDAIRIVARLRERFPDARLVLAGSVKFNESATSFDNVSYVESLHRLVAELDLANAVTFAGECEEVSALLPELDVLLVPSWDEPFGRTVVEAMAAGTPVVATSVGGPAEILRDGETGILLPPRDPELWAEVLGDLIADPVRLRELAAAGRRSIDVFRPERHVRCVRRAYAEVLC